MTSTAPRDPLPHEPRAAASTGARTGAPDLDEAVARLRAWRSGPGAPGPGQHRPATPPPTSSEAAHTDATVATDATDATDDLAGRLAARRSARHVAAAYAAVHGHPITGAEAGETAPGRRRWRLGLRAAVVASVAVLLLGIVASALALGGPDDVTTLAGAGPGATAGGVDAVGELPSSGSPSAGSPSAGSPSSGSASAPSSSGATSDQASAAPTPEGAGTDARAEVVVHVVGAVGEPGLVTVPAGARVADAIEAAGGATSKADTAALNLARAVADGEQIVVPEPGDVVVPAPEAGTGTAAGGGADGPGAAVLDLNAASAADLDGLPGIGPVLAERIVAWRAAHGPFTAVEELDEVSGIGPAVLERLRDLVRV